MAGSRLRVARLSGSFGGASNGYATLQSRGNRAGKAMSDKILNIFDQFEGATGEIMLDAMGPTFEKSQEYTPKLTGELRESGYLENVGSSAKPVVQIGYGKGGTPDYTVYVHEMTTIPHAEPTRSKFLQAAVMEDLDLIYARLGQGYKRFMGS